MTEIKIESVSKSKIKLADCRLRTEDSRNTLRFAYCLLPTAYLPYLLMIVMFLLTFTIELHPTIHYVSHTGSSTPPYTSWETAADSIQKAIDICEPGDTVLVANGVYYEALYIDKTIHLIGSSMDSTIIDGTSETINDLIYFIDNNSSFKNFKIWNLGTTKVGVQARRANIKVEYVLLDIIGIALYVSSSSVNVSKTFIISRYPNNWGIYEVCPNDNCNSEYFYNTIYAKDATNTLILHFFGGSPKMNNNIIISENSFRGASFESQKRVVFKNNLFSGFQRSNMSVRSHSDTVFVINNNSMNVQNESAFDITYWDKTVTSNNIIKNSPIGFYGGVRSDYNLFDNVNTPVTWGGYLGDGNVFADPMFVKDTIPRPNGSYDFRLQAYSPAIDAGDPAILDVDGSRSDIGMYGGPLGESYKYKDLAPRPPRNLSAVVDSNQILVKWNRNTEADTSHYNVYRDTIANFTIDSTKLISLQTDTFYIQYPPYQSSRYVYKITCVDKQGNESLPSEELVINITSLPMNDHPITVSDYLLYQNYPNPFNPSTTIAYKLKERAYVKLMVYDIKGELISVLVNKEQESGYYEVEFNVGNGLLSVPNNLASGIYLYRIEVIGEGRIPVYTEMKKMLMLK